MRQGTTRPTSGTGDWGRRVTPPSWRLLPTKDVLVSADSDFSALLAHERRSSPSLVFFRQQDGRRVEALAGMLLENLDRFAPDLEAGAIVVIANDRIRIRALPLLPPAA